MSTTDFHTIGIVRPSFPPLSDLCVVAFAEGHGDDPFVGITSLTGDSEEWSVTLDRRQVLALADALRQAAAHLWGGPST